MDGEYFEKKHKYDWQIVHDYLQEEYAINPRINSLGIRSVVIPNTIEPQNPLRIPSQVVKRKATPYWMEQGWRQDSLGYRGRYKTEHGSWEGYIHVEFGNEYKFYIYNPPEQLRNHSHWRCFRKQDSYGKYWVHFSDNPENIDSGILSIEKILAESFE